MAGLTPEELAEELSFLTNRWIMQVSPVTDWDHDREGRAPRLALIPVTTDLRAEIAEEMADDFKQETGFDFPPFSKSDRHHDDVDTFLIGSPQFVYLIPVASGALSVSRAWTKPVLTWVWLHPVERTKTPDAWSDTWKLLEERYPGICVEAPLTPPMEAWARRRGLYESGRVVSRAN